MDEESRQKKLRLAGICAIFGFITGAAGQYFWPTLGSIEKALVIMLGSTLAVVSSGVVLMLMRSKK